jgi:hypothetical protein
MLIDHLPSASSMFVTDDQDGVLADFARNIAWWTETSTFWSLDVFES